MIKEVKEMKKYLIALTCGLLSSTAVVADAWVNEYKTLKKSNFMTLCPIDNFTDDHKRLECIVKSHKKADQRLNQIYQETLKNFKQDYQDNLKFLDASDRARLPNSPEILRKAQNSWINVRDQDCQLEANSVWGGSLYSQLLLTCELHKTLQRSAELLKLNHCNISSSSDVCI